MKWLGFLKETDEKALTLAYFVCAAVFWIVASALAAYLLFTRVF